MRTSKKEQLLLAAFDIIEKDGLQALTYESLAAATDISKSGLIYHFPSRNHLIADLNRYAANNWVERLKAEAGGDLGEITIYDRLRALIKVHAEMSSRADLILTVDAMENPDLAAIWNEEFCKWLISEEYAGEDIFLIQLVSDGLWLHDYISGGGLSGEQREKAVKNACELVDLLEARSRH
ncbi:MAG: TetR/AcrR family transcriptional regulator [Corynebacterium sp.]|nr:TetR/AcrR family transcriptional regulator [Corynebacterium sp.]